MIRATAQVRTEGLDAYIKKLDDALDGGAEDVAQQIATTWRNNVPVATGAYKQSIFVQTHDHTEFDAAAGRAQAANPHAGIISEPPMLARKGAAAVGAAVDYAEMVEFGTNKTPAQPAFIPAVESARSGLKAAFSKRIQP